MLRATDSGLAITGPHHNHQDIIRAINGAGTDDWKAMKPPGPDWLLLALIGAIVLVAVAYFGVVFFA